MNCLQCGKPLRSPLPQGWHTSCVRRFFGINEIPVIDLDEKTLAELSVQNVSKGYTVPGVQKKLSLHLSEEKRARLTVVNYPTGFILKPQVKEYEAMPEAEQLAMCMADSVGIATVPHGLIKAGAHYAYITKRIDRVFVKNADMQMLAMEDFCQLDLRLTQDKYKGSYERCANVITRFSSRSGLDVTELYIRLLFSFLIGNSDMHLKNFSLLETAAASGRYILSPAYDLLPVKIILPEDTEQFALTMHGKKTNIRRKDFLAFADACGIPQGVAEKIMQKLIQQAPMLLSMCETSLLPLRMQEELSALIQQRVKQLQ